MWIVILLFTHYLQILTYNKPLISGKYQIVTNAYFAAELYKSTIYLKLEFPFVPIKTGERMQFLFLIRLTKVGMYSYISFSMGFFLI